MKNNDIQITFNRQFFVDLAKTSELNVEHIRLLSDVHNHEIVVGGKLLDELIEVQTQLERLEAMGDDELRAFFIELPRPTPDEWGNSEEEIADWEAYNPMETYWFHISATRYNQCRSLIFNNKKFRYFVVTNQSSYALRGSGFQNGQWYEDCLTKIFSYLKNLIDAIVSNPDGYNEYVANNLYSANIDVAIDVATALYKSGAPLEISDAEKLLKILCEEDYVGLMPCTFHNYMNHHDEGTVYELPWEYQLSDDCDDSESLLTKAQYDELVSLAEWDEIRKVRVKM